MTTVTGKTAAAMQEIADASIVSGLINGSGHLILTASGGDTVDAGLVTGAEGPAGATGPQGPIGVGPAGIVAMWAAAIPPAGWLICDGSEISRSTYRDLFSAIGTIWGNGNTITTFNLPNMQQKFPRQDTGNLGVSAGSSNHVHSITDHNHQIDGGSSQAFAHITIQTGTGPNIFLERLSGLGNWTPGFQGDISPETNPSGTQSTGARVTGTTQNAGLTTTAVTTALPPYTNINFIIKY
jgi:microcystin-dependent protein